MTKPPSYAVRTKADEQAVKEGCYWDDDAANKIIKFAENVYKPQYITGKFGLLDWQRKFLMCLYGWKNKQGNRRFRSANLHVAKKNGKTLLVSIISAYELCAAGEPSPFVATGSVSKENAGQVFSELRHTLQKAKLTKFAKITANQKKIAIPSLNAEYRSLASDGDRVQGYNCSIVIIDEAHAHKSSSLYDSLKYATAARPNGLLVVISTAGDDPSQFYHSIYSKSKRILSGEDLDTTHYAEVYESDPESDPDDEKEWFKANPSLGTSFTTEQFRRELAAARNDSSEWYRFQRYKLNRWVRPDEHAYYDVSIFDKGKTSEPDTKNKDLFIGVDLSQTTDPSSIAACWHLGGRVYYVKCWAWVAREGVLIREKTTFPLYQQFQQSGHMTITEGDRIDDLLIYGHLIDLIRGNRVKGVVFDPTSAMILMGMTEKENVPVLRMSQTHKYYNEPMKEFSKAMVEGRIKHDGNNWLRYCLQQVRIDEDKQGNIRPNTRRSIDHIDGAIATLMAFSQAMVAGARTEVNGRSVYNERGVIWV